MKNNILVIGSTGNLGSKLLNYTKKNKINIHTCTCFKNKKKLLNQKINYNLNFSFTLSDEVDEKKFLSHINKNNFKIIYFLDYSSSSLKYLDVLLKINHNSIFAIANKELIITAGKILINKLKKTNNILIPLDSEHFSIYNSMTQNNISKVYLTASGGPFYFKKNLDLNKVTFKDVINHPKWKMGINNSIDSSNFVNKLLEMFEVSILFDIDINKVDFVVSPQAYIHSIIVYDDNSIKLNCFHNDMLITLIKPLSLVFKSQNLKFNHNQIFNLDNFKINKFDDKRFKIIKNLSFLKKIDHKSQIKLMILNNRAHTLYLNNDIKYNDIIDYIVKGLKNNNYENKINSFNRILNYINFLNHNYV